MIVALTSAFLLLAAQPVNDPQDDDTTFSETQPVRLAPLPAARAFSAFRDICMANFPDPAAFDRAAAASDLGFVRSAHPERGAEDWSSRYGQIVLRQAQHPEREARRDRREGHERRERWLARCDYWGAIEERLTPDALVAAIGAQLAPQVRPREEIVGVSWTLGATEAGTSLRLVYLPSNDDPRLFNLSLQRLGENPGP